MSELTEDNIPEIEPKTVKPDIVLPETAFGAARKLGKPGKIRKGNPGALEKARVAKKIKAEKNERDLEFINQNIVSMRDELAEIKNTLSIVQQIGNEQRRINDDMYYEANKVAPPISRDEPSYKSFREKLQTLQL